MAAELVQRQVSVLVTAGPPAVNAAKLATGSIPIVFIVGLDPVAAGLVKSFNRPGANATGVSMVVGPLGQKRLELIRALVPDVTVVGMLVNPLGPDSGPEILDVQEAARANNIQLKLIHASTPEELGRKPINLSGEHLVQSPLCTNSDRMLRRRELSRCANRRHG